MSKVRSLISTLLGLLALTALVVGLAWLLGPQGPRPGQQMSPAQQVLPTTTVGVSPIPTPTPGEPLPQPVLKVQPVSREVLVGEKIAFLRGQDLWIANVAGRALTQVSVSGNVAHIYGWSHDDNQILLGVREQQVLPDTGMARGTDLWAVDVQESNAVQLTQGLEVRDAAWSPVDNQIAYTIRNNGLYIVGSNRTESSEVADRAIKTPVWSPDGTKVAFIIPPPTWTGGPVEMYDIAVLNLADNSIAQLTSESWENLYPTWSLDGKRILFESTRDYLSGSRFWYTMNVDGSDLRHLKTPDLLVATNVERSPVANRVVFEVSGGIWVMNFDGNALKVAEGSDPSWSPDGSKLVYVGEDSGVWIVNLDDKSAERLSDAGSQPSWSD